MSSASSPCAACKFLRRKCTQECDFAPYFPPEQPQKFAAVHRVYGASNIAKILKELHPTQREQAVNSLVFEAGVRLQDPVYGAAGIIAHLQETLRQIKTETSNIKKELENDIGPQAMKELENYIGTQAMPKNPPRAFMPQRLVGNPAESSSRTSRIGPSGGALVIPGSQLPQAAHYQQQHVFGPQQLAPAMTATGHGEILSNYEQRQQQQQALSLFNSGCGAAGSVSDTRFHPFTDVAGDQQLAPAMAARDRVEILSNYEQQQQQQQALSLFNSGLDAAGSVSDTRFHPLADVAGDQQLAPTMAARDRVEILSNYEQLQQQQQQVLPLFNSGFGVAGSVSDTLFHPLTDAGGDQQLAPTMSVRDRVEILSNYEQLQQQQQALPLFNSGFGAAGSVSDTRFHPLTDATGDQQLAPAMAAGDRVEILRNYEQHQQQQQQQQQQALSLFNSGYGAAGSVSDTRFHPLTDASGDQQLAPAMAVGDRLEILRNYEQQQQQQQQEALSLFDRGYGAAGSISDTRFHPLTDAAGMNPSLALGTFQNPFQIQPQQVEHNLNQLEAQLLVPSQDAEQTQRPQEQQPPHTQQMQQRSTEEEGMGAGHSCPTQ